jgi:3-hydroxyisobutyrate dehydrogenase
MASIGFIGLGHMGLPMSANLIKAGHTVWGYDLMPAHLEAFKALGGNCANSALNAATNRDFVITMLPESRHVEAVYLGESGLLSAIKSPTFFIECSTIDPVASQGLHKACDATGSHKMIDAPVSGGVIGAENATLTIMVGGTEADYKAAQPILSIMGKNIFHAGAASHGQAAKTCNNMMLGIHMIATCEAFVLAEKLGLDAQKLFEIAASSSGQNWSLTSYCPVPGLLPTSPANRDYEPGFAASMMLKDLNQAQRAAMEAGVALPLGKAATNLYESFCKAGFDKRDFSAIIKYIRTSKTTPLDA